MNLLIWIFFGALVGWAVAAVANKDGSKEKTIAYIVAGILGALLAAVLSAQFGGPGITLFTIGEVLLALVGAIIFVVIAYVLMDKIGKGQDKKEE